MDNMSSKEYSEIADLCRGIAAFFVIMGTLFPFGGKSIWGGFLGYRCDIQLSYAAFYANLWILFL